MQFLDKLVGHHDIVSPIAPFSESDALQTIFDINARYLGAKINNDVHPDDGFSGPVTAKDMQHYNGDGQSAMQIVLAALLTSSSQAPKRILDLPCGYGRIARHFAAAFPDAELVCSDLFPPMTGWCLAKYGAVPVLSKRDLSAVQFDQGFDLIWSGSLLTHLPEKNFRNAFDLFSRSLNPGGLAVVTLHGRFASVFGAGRYTSPERFAGLKKQYDDTGFGYIDYRDKKDDNTGSYGLTLSAPSFVFGLLEADPSIKIVSYTERGWHDHQDVIVLKKEPVLDIPAGR